MNVYDLLPKHLDKDAKLTILELGAHFGEDSEKLRAMFPNAEIYIFEPDPRNINYIKYKKIHEKVHLIEAAVSNYDGKTMLHMSSGEPPQPQPEFNEYDWSYSSSIKTPTNHLTEAPWCKFDYNLEIDCVTLNKFCRDRDIWNIDLIWADVQGATDLVIDGGYTAFRHTNLFYTECSDVPMYCTDPNLETILQMLPQKWDILHRFPNDVLLKRQIKEP